MYGKHLTALDLLFLFNVAGSSPQVRLGQGEGTVQNAQLDPPGTAGVVGAVPSYEPKA